MTFGKNSRNTVFYKKYQVSPTLTSFEFGAGDATTPLSFKNYLLPEEYREVFAAAILVGTSLGLTSVKIKESLEKNFKIPPSRSSLFEGIKNTIIIDSSYNASKASVQAFLHLVGRLKENEKRQVIFIFGDMRELGEESEIEHRSVATEIDNVVDYLYCVGTQTKQFVVPNVKRVKEVKWFENSQDAGQYVSEHLPDRAIILVKGSQNTIFLEEAIKPLLKNREDIKKLCRQANYWLKKKQDL